MVPEGWRYCRFDEIADFKNGLNFPATARGTGLKIVGVGDFGDNLRIGVDRLEQVAGFDEIDPDYLIQSGDLLFVRSNGNKALVGRVLYFDHVTERIGHSGFTIRARVRGTGALALFVGHFFHDGMARGQFHRLGAGTNISNLSQDVLGAVEIPIPPEPVRTSLVKQFETWARAIRATRSAIKAKRRMKRGLMQQLLTGKRRFPGFAEPWRECHIGDVLKEVSRPVAWDDDALYRLVSVRRWAGGVFVREELHGREIKVKKLNTIHTGDMLISHIQSAYGAMALVGPEFDGQQISELYTVLVPRNSKEFDARFFAYLAQRKYMWHQAYVASNGFLAERLRLNFSPADFLKRPIRVPPTIGEQRRIIEVLETCDREIAALNRQLELLKDQKKGLMQKLLTGQIRVKGTSR